MFSTTDDERLIEQVRHHPVLYDLSNPKYLDSKYKYEIWERIAAELGKEACDCKQRWGNIRDQYRKSSKKEITRSGQAASQIRQYKYKKLLDFLNSTFVERDTISNLTVSEGTVDDPKGSSSDEDEGEQTDTVTQPATVPTPTNPRKISTKQKVKTYSRKKVNKDVGSSASAKLMEYLISNKNSNTKEPHPVDAFLAGIAPILKSLDTIKQHKARSEIFAVVQKYELDMLLNNDVTPVPATKPTSPMPEAETQSLCDSFFMASPLNPEPDPDTTDLSPSQVLQIPLDPITEPSEQKPKKVRKRAINFGNRNQPKLTVSMSGAENQLFDPLLFSSPMDSDPDPESWRDLSPSQVPSQPRNNPAVREAKTARTTIVNITTSNQTRASPSTRGANRQLVVPLLDPEPNPSQTLQVQSQWRNEPEEKEPKKARVINIGTNHPLTMTQFLQNFK